MGSGGGGSLEVSWLPAPPPPPGSGAQGKALRGKGDLPRRKGISEIQEQVGWGTASVPRTGVNKYLLRIYYKDLPVTIL